jgi:hypothetical protein
MGPVSLTVPPSRKETEKPVHDRLFAFLPGQVVRDLEILVSFRFSSVRWR